MEQEKSTSQMAVREVLFWAIVAVGGHIFSLACVIAVTLILNTMELPVVLITLTLSTLAWVFGALFVRKVIQQWKKPYPEARDFPVISLPKTKDKAAPKKSGRKSSRKKSG